MAKDERDVAPPPAYELIGADVQADGPDMDDDGGPPPARLGALAVRQAIADCWRSIRTVRFWLASAAIVLACWGTGVLLVIATVTGGDYPPEVHGWGYILTAAMLIVASSLLGVRWGLAPWPGEPAPNHRRLQDPVRSWLAGSVRGVVFTALAAAFLLMLAVTAGGQAEIAGVAAVVMVMEFVVFSGIAAGASAWFPRRAARAVAWTTTGLLLFGNVVAVVALLPTVRAYEPVLVAINIQRDSLGRTISYECSPEFRGIAEVYHTERIFWLATANPLVIFGLLAGEAAPQEDALGWLPGELQTAVEGTQLPCANGAPMAEPGAGLPLTFGGVALQSLVTATFVVAGHWRSRQRVEAPAE